MMKKILILELCRKVCVVNLRLPCPLVAPAILQCLSAPLFRPAAVVLCLQSLYCNTANVRLVKHACYGKQSISYIVVFVCYFTYELYLLFCSFIYFRAGHFIIGAVYLVN